MKAGLSGFSFGAFISLAGDHKPSLESLWAPLWEGYVKKSFFLQLSLTLHTPVGVHRFRSCHLGDAMGLSL